MGSNFAEGVNVYDMCGMFAMWGPKALIRELNVTGEFLRRKHTKLCDVVQYPSNRGVGLVQNYTCNNLLAKMKISTM